MVCSLQTILMCSQFKIGANYKDTLLIHLKNIKDRYKAVNTISASEAACSSCDLGRNAYLEQEVNILMGMGIRGK